MTDVPTTEPAAVPSSLSRRGFLVGGGALASVLMLRAGGVAAALGQPGGENASRRGLSAHSLAYLAGSDRLVKPRLDDLVAATWVAMPAHRLTSGDRALTSARVRILGMWPLGAAGRPGLPAVDLDILVAQPNGPAVPFYAWTIRPPAQSSNPVGFTVATAAPHSLTIVMTVRPVSANGALGAPSTSEVTLTTGSAPGLPKLRRGVYLVGVAPGDWRQGGIITPSSPASIVVAIGET